MNTAAHSLNVFTLQGDIPVLEREIPVGLEPDSVRVRTNQEAWVVNHLSDSISIVNLSSGVVTRVLQTDDEPADVVFAGNPLRAFVSCSQPDLIQVFDLTNLAWIIHEKALARL